MAKADARAKDSAMAGRMKQKPWSFPDSAMRPWQGCGAEYRKGAHGGSGVLQSRYEWGLLGGVLCSRLGMGDYGVPKELIRHF